jgi:hypothetical protein
MMAVRDANKHHGFSLPKLWFNKFRAHYKQHVATQVVKNDLKLLAKQNKLESVKFLTMSLEREILSLLSICLLIVYW